MYYVCNKKTGRRGPRCKSCISLNEKARYAANPELAKARASKFRAENPELKKLLDKSHYQKNRKERIFRQTQYTKANREAIKVTRAKYIKNRLITHPTFRFIRNLRKRTWEAFRCQGVVKQGHTLDFLGCSPMELKSWIECNLQPGMTLQNYGQCWHLDHDIPCSAWDLTDQEQVSACFHWTNILPMFSIENMSKGGANRDFEYGPAIAERLMVLRALA